MKFDLFPNGKPFNLILGFRVLNPVKLEVCVFDPESKRIFARRWVKMARSSSVTIKLPVTPDNLRTQILGVPATDLSQIQLKSIKVTPDTQCPVNLTEQDKQFISFAVWFAKELPRLDAGIKGTLYQSNGFSILYLDEIKEENSELSTPSRIEQLSGVIEVSKHRVSNYTVPMLIVMLLHEYSHKYKNPQYRKAIGNEITADIIAVHMALNLGYDPVEIQNCFKAVFALKDTDLNRRRMKAINEFIDLFKSNESKRCNTKSHAR